MQAQREESAPPVRRAVLVTVDDVAILDAAIALLRVADLMHERLPQLVALRDRMAGSATRR